jgi:GT2 family glycosyltransferase
VDVSIIIVNWNTKELLRNCLSSVYEYAGNVDYEVIVIDNASTDGSAEMVKNDFQQVILIENSDNRGFAAANNQGMAIAKGRYVLLLNSDTVVLDNAIADTVRFADENPQAAVIGCRVLNPDRTLQRTCFMFPSILNMLLSSTYLYKLFPKSRFFGRENMTWWDATDVREVDYVRGCFMLVRREGIEQVGLMDERFFMYSEETDWCYRFKKGGWKVVFMPKADIIHLLGASTKKKRTEMTLQVWGSLLLFFKKHKSVPTYATMCFLIAIFLILRIPYWLGLAICSSNNRANYLKIAKTYMFGAYKAILGGRGLLVQR